MPRLTAGPFRYRRYADSYLDVALRYARVPVKQAVISPSALSLLYPAEEMADYPREHFIDDLLNEHEKEVRACLRKGAHSVQVDFTEGRLAVKIDPSGGLLHSFIDLNNLALSRFSADERRYIGVHTCPGGDRDSTHSADVDYAELLPSLFELKAGQLLHRARRRERPPSGCSSIIRDHMKPQQRIFVGVVAPIDPRIETPEEVRERVLQAARYIPVAQLGTTDDCGFAPFCDDESTSRETAFAKIRRACRRNGHGFARTGVVVVPSDDEELLRAVALRNASAILQARQRAEEELVRAKESLEARTRELEALNTAGAAIASTLELASVLQAVTDAATQASGADFGAFFYNTTDAEGDAYSLYSLSGAPRAAFEKFGQPRATPLFAKTFNGEGPERCDDVLQHPLYGRMGPHHGMPQGHLPVRSYMAVPVRSRGGEVLGGLFFGHREPGVFTDSSERLALGIAAQASIAIDNARLYADASRMAEDRERLAAAERAARAAADRASRIKDEFLATLSHELRTPLMAILGWSKVLLAKRTDAEQLAKGLEAIARNAGAQAKLIEDLLDMSRIISGKVRLDVQPTDLSTVIAAAVDSVRPSADAKEIRLRTILDPGAGPVSGDPSRLQQVVWNLVLNAIKFTPKKGSVDVVLERVNSHVEISIADSGIGISAEFLPQVFDRFMQADSSTVRTQGGLGLGLSIVKHLVELHGGTVRVDQRRRKPRLDIRRKPAAGLGAHGDREARASGLSDDPGDGPYAGRTSRRACARGR